VRKGEGGKGKDRDWKKVALFFKFSNIKLQTEFPKRISDNVDDPHHIRRIT